MIADHLKAWREFCSVDIHDLAKATGLPVARLMRLEEFPQPIPPNELELIAKALGVKPGHMLSGPPTPETADLVEDALDRYAESIVPQGTGLEALRHTIDTLTLASYAATKGRTPEEVDAYWRELRAVIEGRIREHLEPKP